MNISHPWLAACFLLLPLGCVWSATDENQEALTLLRQAADAYIDDGPVAAVYRIATTSAQSPSEPAVDPADWDSLRETLHLGHGCLLVRQQPWNPPTDARSTKIAAFSTWSLALMPGRSESYEGFLDMIDIRSLPADPALHNGTHAPRYLTPFWWLGFSETEAPQVDGSRLNPGIWRDSAARHALIASADHAHGWTWKRQGDGFIGTRQIGQSMLGWTLEMVEAAPNDHLYDLEVHLSPATDGLPARVADYQLIPRTKQTWGFAITSRFRALGDGKVILEDAWWRSTPIRADVVHVTLVSLSQKPEDLPLSWHLDPLPTTVVPEKRVEPPPH